MNRGKAQRRLLPRRRPAPALTLVVRAAMVAIAAIVAIVTMLPQVACRRADAEGSGRDEGADRTKPAALGHDAYVWQRQWTLSLDRAVTASASRVRAWRVLAAEIDARGQTAESSPHLDVLARTGRPVIPVFRISGRLPDWDESARTAPNTPTTPNSLTAETDRNGRSARSDTIARELIRRTQALVQRWRDAGVDIAGVETDYDCPTSSLPRYASFLAALRQAHPRGVTLSITALPTWLDSARLRDVLQHVDEAVLQVHAVQHPQAGLFDREQARTWAREWAEVGRKAGGVPFRIALPTYGSRVTWTRAGRITAIESEARTFADPASGRELVVTPRDVAAFLDAVRDDRPPALTGLVWFRVPTAEDARAWSLDTWHAVMDGRVLPPDIHASVEPSATIPGLYDVYVNNRGNVDAMAPERVTLTSRRTCESADAVGPYAVEKLPTAIEFRRVSPRLLARDRRTLIGWVRCPIEEIQVHAGS